MTNGAFIRTPDGRIDAIPHGVRLSPLKWIIGRWRMFWKLCPACNSDAPKIDTCEVCKNNREAYYRHTPYIKKLWWNRYVLLSAGIADVFEEQKEERELTQDY